MPNHEPRLNDYLQHIMQAIYHIQQDVATIDFDSFKDNDTIQRSVVFSFIIIGEASNKLIQKHPDFVMCHSQVAWQAMKGMPISYA